MVSHVAAVTMNSSEPARTAAFWAACLDGAVADGGNGFLHVTSAGVLVIVQPAPGRVADRETDVHLDLRAPDRDREVARLVTLGARVVEERADSHGRWTVLLDPDGRQFCVS
jgi:predicted enzyme related to lactoylglutathione lyase